MDQLDVSVFQNLLVLYLQLQYLQLGLPVDSLLHLPAVDLLLLVLHLPAVDLLLLVLHFEFLAVLVYFREILLVICFIF